MAEKKLYSRDNWQSQFQSWKTHKSLESSSHKASPDQIKKDITDIFQTTLFPSSAVKSKFPTSSSSIAKKQKPSKSIFSLRILIILIALAIVGYVVYSNFIAHHEFEYYYDIGSGDDASKNYLGPTYRVSPPQVDENNSSSTTYRNLSSQLVYFDVPVARGSDEIKIEVRFKDDFPKNSKMILGAKNGSDWSYIWKDTYTKNDSVNQVWKTVSQSYYLKKDNLYLRDGKLSVVFNDYHLNPDRNQTNTKYIPVDWIEVTVIKPGMFEK